MSHKLIDDIGPRYVDRNGGYTRILKLGPAPGRQRPHGPHRAGLTSGARRRWRLTLFEDTDTPAAPSGPLVRVRMTVAYDGSGFHGFAPNAGRHHRGRHAAARRSSGCCGCRSS